MFLWAAFFSSTLQWAPAKPHPGDAVWFWLEGAASTSSVEIDGIRYTLKPQAGRLAGFAALPIELAPGPVQVGILLDERRYAAELLVSTRNDRTVSLRVGRKYGSKPDSALQARLVKERAVMSALFTQPSTRQFEPGPAAMPVRGVLRVTDRYGTQRLFNGALQSRHYGLDLGGGVGRPIYAIYPGEIVLRARHFYSGNTVVIDHGSNLLSLYFHLSKMRPGVSNLKAGAPLGRMGSTGRVTGPHLHLSVAVRGVDAKGEVRRMYVDPEPLLSPRWFLDTASAKLAQEPVSTSL